MAMAWVDYKKDYEIVPHNKVIEFLGMFGIANNLKEVLRNSMQS